MENKGGERENFASRGGGVVRINPGAAQQRLPCQAGVRPHSQNYRVFT